MVFAGIDSGYTRKCKNSLGGISELFLFPYVEYSRSQIVTNGNVLTTFPTTSIYKFAFNGNPAPNEPQEVDAGGKFYNQSISIDLQYKNDAFQLQKLLNKDYRIIFKDRNGIYHIFGLFNGLEADQLNYTTGNSKNDLNGFKIDFSGKEEKGSFFINDLESAGFFNADFNYRILENGDFRITEDVKFRILE